MLNLTQQERLRHRYQTEVVPGYRLGLDVYRELLARHIAPGTTVLDAGCGPAGLVSDFETTATVIGVDLHLTGFTEFDGNFGITKLAESPLHTLPFPNNTFDVVTCSWVLEHIADPLASIREVARVMKPGGRLIFITPNALNYVVGLRRLVPQALSRRVVKWIYGRDEDFINPTYYRLNTPYDLERVGIASGLIAERLQTVGDPTYLAVNELAFQLAVRVERLLEATYPQRRVHLVGVYRKVRP